MKEKALRIMDSTKPKVVFACIAAILTLVMAACGGGAPDSAAESNGQPTTTGIGSTATAEPTISPTLVLTATPSPTSVQPSTPIVAPSPIPTATPTPAPMPTPTPVPSAKVVSVEIAPPITSLNIGETQQFTFKAFDDVGEEITSVLASWRVDPQIGVIDSQGLFTAAAKAGDYFMGVELEVISGTYRATDKADAIIVPDSLATIEVSPTPVILAAGGELQLRAKGFDRHGNEIKGLQFLWEATPGVEIDAQRVLSKATGPSEGLVGWWRGEGNAQDSAGVNHGTVVNGTDYVPGVVGTAFGFDGVDQYITVQPSAELNITGDVTVSLWVKRTVIAYARVRLINQGGGLVNGVDVPTAYGLFFGSPASGPLGPGNFASMEFETADGSNQYLVSSVATDAEFHHHAFVRKGNVQTLFFDGEIVASATFTGTPGDTAGLPLVIGNLHNPDDPAGLSFGGIIDEVRIYNEALLDSEIKAVFDSENPNAQHEVTVRATYKNSVRTTTVDVNVAAD